MPPENRIISIYLLYMDMPNNEMRQKYLKKLEWPYLNDTMEAKIVINY